MMNITARGTDKAKVIEVIETISMRGNGTEENPARLVKQYWDFKGNKLAEKDEFKEECMRELYKEQKRAKEGTNV